MDFHGSRPMKRVSREKPFVYKKMLLLSLETYRPTGNPYLIGVVSCRNGHEAKESEKYILNHKCQRSHPDREWVIIDETFNEMIDEAFTRIDEEI